MPYRARSAKQLSALGPMLGPTKTASWFTKRFQEVSWLSWRRGRDAKTALSRALVAARVLFPRKFPHPADIGRKVRRQKCHRLPQNALKAQREGPKFEDDAGRVSS